MAAAAGGVLRLARVRGAVAARGRRGHDAGRGGQPARSSGRARAGAVAARRSRSPRPRWACPCSSPRSCARPRPRRRWRRSPPTSSSSSPTAASCRSACSICRGSGPTTCTRRCCPGCAAPRRSSGRSSAATARPACRSCAWRRGSTPGRWRRCARCRSPTTTRRGRCPTSSPRWAPGCSRETLPAIAGGTRHAGAAGSTRAATLAPMLTKADGHLTFDRPARVVSAHARGVDPWPGASAMLDGAPLKLFAPRVVDAVGADGRPGRGAGPAARGAGDRLRGRRDRVRRAAAPGTAAPAGRGGARRAPHPRGHGPRVSPGKGPPPRRGSPARRRRRPARPRRR